MLPNGTFRLIVAAVQASGIKSLKRGHVPGWKLHIGAGDSLLFGSRPMFGGGREVIKHQGTFLEVPSIYAVEEPKLAHEILDQGYHAVVGNPPYITVKDEASKRVLSRLVTARAIAGTHLESLLPNDSGCLQSRKVREPLCSRLYWDDYSQLIYEERIWQEAN